MEQFTDTKIVYQGSEVISYITIYKIDHALEKRQSAGRISSEDRSNKEWMPKANK